MASQQESALSIAARAIWTGRLTVLTTALAGFICAVIYLNFALFTYTAELKVVPVQSQNQSLSSRFGDLASLAGVDLDKGQSVSPFVLYTVMINSRAVADTLSLQPHIMHNIFRTQWDDENQRWRQPDGLLYDIIAFVKPILGLRNYPWAPPGSYELYRAMQDRLMIAEDVKKSTVTLSFSDTDRTFAAFFLQTVHETTDRMMRQSMLDRASKYANFIQKQLYTAQLAELRAVLTQNLSQQETLIMMSSSNAAFAAQPVGPAESSTRPTAPKPSIILLMGMVLGAVAGAILVIYQISIFAFFRRERDKPVAQAEL